MGYVSDVKYVKGLTSHEFRPNGKKLPKCRTL